MSYCLTSAEMKAIDEYSINTVGIPALVLMERAALCVADIVEAENEKGSIYVFYGRGNNGGDGLAAARILALHGRRVVAVAAFDDEADRMSEQALVQRNAAKNCRVIFKSMSELGTEPGPESIIIDAVFGIGLTRKLSGSFERAISLINNAGCRVYAVDIPSGISADTGAVMGCAVKASATITFGYAKRGLLLYPGASHAGKIHIADAGFAGLPAAADYCSYYLGPKEVLLPKRYPDSNKGSYGRVLFIGGNAGTAGAGYFSACAAAYVGAGLVKALVGAEAARLLNDKAPEIMAKAFFDCDGAYSEKELDESLEWATVVLAGPGLGRGIYSVQLVERLLKSGKQLILDADALNIIATLLKTDKGQRKPEELIEGRTVLTPHMAELSRLSGSDVAYLKEHIFDFAKDFAYNNRLVYVCKDARTLVCSEGRMHINVNGNNGMSAGGSGDVLAGVIAGLCAAGLEPYEAAKTGTFIHGLAGDLAAKAKGVDGMGACDILDMLPAGMKTVRDSGKDKRGME